MNEDQQPELAQNQDTQTPQVTTSHETILQPSDPKNRSGKKKKYIIISIVLFVLALIGSATAYVLLIYIPNKPENVFKKAVLNYMSNGGGYSVTARVDQPGPNDPDYDLLLTKSKDNNASAEVTINTFLQRPSVAMQTVNGIEYVKFSGFEDSKKLATHYSNNGEKGIQEYIAWFTEGANITPNLDKWLEVGAYMFDQPMTQGKVDEQPKNTDGLQLTSIGSTETMNGKTVRKYEITLSKDSFNQLISFTEGSSVPLISALMPSGGITASELKVTVWVDLKTKTILQAKYSGRPFKEATLELTIKSEDNISIDIPKAAKLTDKLSYGILNTNVFNKNYQFGGTKNDHERIADMKGIKTALEIFKARNGHYPERYEMSVNQASFISSNMPGADIQIFTDPAGRLIGLHGSQYAYVGTLKDGSETCDRYTKPCEKFFIMTTLDDGSEYQLNSD